MLRVELDVLSGLQALPGVVPMCATFGGRFQNRLQIALAQVLRAETLGELARGLPDAATRREPSSRRFFAARRWVWALAAISPDVQDVANPRRIGGWVRNSDDIRTISSEQRIRFLVGGHRVPRIVGLDAGGYPSRCRYRALREGTIGWYSLRVRRGRILAIKWGMNPNSSSLGVDVTFLLAGATVLAVVTPLIGALLRWRRPVQREAAEASPEKPGTPA